MTTAMTTAIQEKFCHAREILNQGLLERSEEIDIALTALACRQHFLMVGPPGTAKSMLVNALCRWMDTDPFVVHMTPDLSKEAVFGPIDIVKLIHEKKYERNMDGSAAKAVIMILEETFRGSASVLNGLLLLMNERIVREGVIKKEVPLRSLFATSNSWSPEGEEANVRAFFDRFLFRKEVSDVRVRNNVSQLIAGKLPEIKFSKIITVSELQQAEEETRNLPLEPRVLPQMEELVFQLRKEGIFVSDRRTSQALSAVRAFAYTQGDRTVQPQHLAILGHVLWTCPKTHKDKCLEICAKFADPVKKELADAKIAVNEALANFDPNNDKSLGMVHATLRTLVKTLRDKHPENVKVKEFADAVSEEYKALRARYTQEVAF